MTDMTLPTDAQIVIPIPADAPPMPEHKSMGLPAQSWTYKDAHGDPLCHVLRFDLPPKVGAKKPGKFFLPATLWKSPDGGLIWDWKALPDPRPLYNLDLIAMSADKDAVILISEGEKAADAAAKLFPDMIATTALNGASAPRKTDWSPCAGRHCVIAADLDEPGAGFAKSVSEILREVGAASVRHLDLTVLAATAWHGDTEVQRLEADIKVGYDLADTLADGWTAARLKAVLEKTALLPTGVTQMPEPPEAETFFDGIPGWNFDCDENGVWKTEERFDPRTKKTTEERHFVCSPLKIIGFARDPNGGDWGRVVDLTDPDGRVRRILVPSQDFAGQGTDVFKRLMSSGLQFMANRATKERLLEYLLGSNPDRRLTHTRQPGWVGNAFGLPDQSFGTDDIICDLGSANHRYKTQGDYVAWQEMAGLAVGNSRLAFAVSAAFAGPLIHPLGQEGGGIHFVGSMGGGKSTLAKVAGSVWGGNGRQTYALSWSGTDSGHEAIAAQANDTFLVLDEIGRADPGLLGTILYQQGNGSGKNRAELDRTPQETKVFTIMVLSNGEITVAEALANSPRASRAMAGQLVRLIDIPADVDEIHGVFEELHGYKDSRAFATHLESVLHRNYGHAARHYLTHLTADLTAAKDAVKGLMEEFFLTACPSGASRQVLRAAARFALIAGAGELAAAFGVLPWPKGEAVRAAKACFNAWLGTQAGTKHTKEKIDAIRAVQRFVSLHGAARFQRLDTDTSHPVADSSYPHQRIIPNRAGYSRLTAEGEEFCILPEVWRSEVCKEGAANQIAQYLYDAGLLVTTEPGRLAKKMRVSDQPKPIRCYVVKPEILAWSETSEADEDIWEGA